MSTHSFQAPSSQNHAPFKLSQVCCKLNFFLWDEALGGLFAFGHTGGRLIRERGGLLEEGGLFTKSNGKDIYDTSQINMNLKYI